MGKLSEATRNLMNNGFQWIDCNLSKICALPSIAFRRRSSCAKMPPKGGTPNLFFGRFHGGAAPVRQEINSQRQQKDTTDDSHNYQSVVANEAQHPLTIKDRQDSLNVI